MDPVKDDCWQHRIEYMSDQKEWLFDDQPDEPGWYAIIKCWDPEEGLFPDAARWDGARWLDNRDRDVTAPISQHAGPFESEATAGKWADDNDPEMPASSNSAGSDQ
jgi:hypothetical protein